MSEKISKFVNHDLRKALRWLFQELVLIKWFQSIDESVISERGRQIIEDPKKLERLNQLVDDFKRTGSLEGRITVDLDNGHTAQ